MLVGCTTDRELPGSPAGLTLPRRFLYSVVMTWLSLDAARTAPITGRRAAPLISKAYHLRGCQDNSPLLYPSAGETVDSAQQDMLHCFEGLRCDKAALLVC